MPTNMMSPTPKWTPFGDTKKLIEGSNSFDASIFLSTTATFLNSSQDSFGVTFNSISALNAQLEALQRQGGEQRTSTKMSTDLGTALDQILAKHSEGSFNRNKSSYDLMTDLGRALDQVNSRSSQVTAGSQESGFDSVV